MTYGNLYMHTTRKHLTFFGYLFTAVLFSLLFVPFVVQAQAPPTTLPSTPPSFDDGFGTGNNPTTSGPPTDLTPPPPGGNPGGTPGGGTPGGTPGGGAPAGGGLTNPLQFGTLEEFLVAILNAVVIIVFPLLVLMLVYAGFLFVKAQGNPAELEKAKRAFLWTLIGAIIVLGAQALSIAIQGTVEELRAEVHDRYFANNDQSNFHG